jgi:hypothetical protein
VVNAKPVGLGWINLQYDIAICWITVVYIVRSEGKDITFITEPIEFYYLAQAKLRNKKPQKWDYLS